MNCIKTVYKLYDVFGSRQNLVAVGRDQKTFENLTLAIH
jgi:hypothetical protein